MVESLDKSRKIHTRLYTSSMVHESEENLLVTPKNVSNQKKKKKNVKSVLSKHKLPPMVTEFFLLRRWQLNLTIVPGFMLALGQILFRTMSIS